MEQITLNDFFEVAQSGKKVSVGRLRRHLSTRYGRAPKAVAETRGGISSPRRAVEHAPSSSEFSIGSLDLENSDLIPLFENLLSGEFGERIAQEALMKAKVSATGFAFFKSGPASEQVMEAFHVARGLRQDCLEYNVILASHFSPHYWNLGGSLQGVSGRQEQVGQSKPASPNEIKALVLKELFLLGGTLASFNRLQMDYVQSQIMSRFWQVFGVNRYATFQEGAEIAAQEIRQAQSIGLERLRALVSERGAIGNRLFLVFMDICSGSIDTANIIAIERSLESLAALESRPVFEIFESCLASACNELGRELCQRVYASVMDPAHPVWSLYRALDKMRRDTGGCRAKTVTDFSQNGLAECYAPRLVTLQEFMRKFMLHIGVRSGVFSTTFMEQVEQDLVHSSQQSRAQEDRFRMEVLQEL